MGAVFVLLLLCCGCGTYNLMAQHSMRRDILSRPRDPETGVVRGTEAKTLPGTNGRAVLLVHGFVGSRVDYNDLGEILNEEGFTVRLTRLPGHGTYTVDHSTTTAEELIEAARAEYLALKSEYDEVVLVGFSMGGSLASILAAEEEVDRLVLIAPYFGVTYRWYYVLPAEALNKMASPMIPYVVKNKFFTCVNRKEAKDQLFYYKVVSTHGAAELMRLGRMAREPETLAKIECPTLALHSRGDRAASPSRSEEAFEHIGAVDKRIVWYEDSNHHILWDYDREEAKAEIVRFLRPPLADAL